MKLYSKLAVAALLLAGIVFNAPVVVTDALAACDFCGGPSHKKPAPVTTPTTPPVTTPPLTPAQQAAKNCAGKDNTPDKKVCCYDMVLGVTASTACKKDVPNKNLTAYQCCIKGQKASIAVGARWNEKGTVLVGPITQSHLPEGTLIGTIWKDPPCDTGGNKQCVTAVVVEGGDILDQIIN